MDRSINPIVGILVSGKALWGAFGLLNDVARQRPSTAFFAFVWLLITALTTAPANAACLPPSAYGAPATQANGPMHVYWDGSLSMLGYVDGASSSMRSLGDAQILLHDFAQGRGQRQDWSRFGGQIVSVRDPTTLATRASYVCRGDKSCDNKQSRMDSVLGAIAASDPASLNVMVTDLWLSDDSFTGSPQIALGEPLKLLLRQGRSIGLIGVRAPYSGPIYDLPSHTTYLGASERPVFIVLVGPRALVVGAYNALANSGSPGFSPDRLRFALFTAHPAQAWLGGASGLHTSGADALPSEVLQAANVGGLPQFRFHMTAAQSNGSAIRTHVAADARLLPGAVWAGALTATTRVWLLPDEGALKRCSAGVWQSFGQLNRAWRQSPGIPNGADFSFDGRSAAGLAPGHDYFVVATLGSSRPLAKTNAADSWIRDWGFAPDQEKSYVAQRPKFFKTLNLGDIAGLLEAALDGATPAQGRDLVQFGFIVRVES
jgi:hypothetical protein